MDRWLPAVVLGISMGVLGFGSNARAGNAGDQPAPLDSGWTPLNPSADSRLVYVSSSGGNDANTGLSAAAPKRTLAAGYDLLRDGYPDWLLLKRDDSWTDAMPHWGKGGRSPTEMMVVGAYGTGERPLLLTGTARGFDLANYPTARAHLAITDVQCWAHTNTGTSSSGGIEIVNNWSDMLIENCRFDQYSTDIAIQGIQMRPSNIRIRRCIINGAISLSGLSSGILIGHSDNILIEENLLDHNGWNTSIPGCVPTMFSHNIYINPDNTTGMVVRGNIVARGSASGIRSSGWLCENNLLLQNPVGIVVGPDTRTVRNNVILDSRDIDAANPRGIGIDGTIGAGVQIYGNTVAHQSTGTGNTRAISLGGVYSGLRIHDNLVYDWIQRVNNQAPAMVLDGAPTSMVYVSNNQFQQLGGALIAQFQPVPAGMYRFSQNVYYSTNTQPFLANPTPLNYAQWLSRSSEVGAQFVQRSYPAPNRTIATYMSSLGGPPSIELFLAMAASQSRWNWRPEFTSQAVGDYIRAGFGQSMIEPCVLDMNGDGRFDVNDFVTFQGYLASADPRADLNHDGVNTLADILAFNAAAAQGCP